MQHTMNVPVISVRCLDFASSIISQSCFVERVGRDASVAAMVSSRFMEDSSLFS